MATAPEELTGEAGSLLNVVRYLGISTGIAGASTLLALGIAAAPGSNGITVDASPSALVFASRVVILMLGILGALAGAFSLLRTVPRPVCTWKAPIRPLTRSTRQAARTSPPRDR